MISLFSLPVRYALIAYAVAVNVIGALSLVVHAHFLSNIYTKSDTFSTGGMSTAITETVTAAFVNHCRDCEYPKGRFLPLKSNKVNAGEEATWKALIEINAALITGLQSAIAMLERCDDYPEEQRRKMIHKLNQLVDASRFFYEPNHATKH